MTMHDPGKIYVVKTVLIQCLKTVPQVHKATPYLLAMNQHP